MVTVPTQNVIAQKLKVRTCLFERREQEHTVLHLRDTESRDAQNNTVIKQQLQLQAQIVRSEQMTKGTYPL